MSRVYYGDRLLFAGRSETETLGDIVLHKTVNAAYELSFLLPPDHPVEIAELAEEVVVLNGYKESFRGQITYLEDSMRGTVLVEARGDLSYFNYSQLRPFDTLTTPELQGITPAGFFAWIVDQHNAQSAFPFVIGKNEANQFWDGTDFVRSSEKDISCAEALKSRLLENPGGFVQTRFENGTRYIDYLADFPVSKQSIEFGENLLDYANGIDAYSLYTAVTAYGKQDDETKQRLDLTSLPDDNYGEFVKVGDYLYHRAAAARYGLRFTTQEFSELETPEGVLNAAMSFLQGTIAPVRSLSVSAFDLSQLPTTTLDEIDICTYVQCKAKPLGFNSFLACTESTIDISEPENSEYGLGQPPVTLTGSTLSSLPQMREALDGVVVAVPEIAQEAKSAAEQAQEASQEAQAAAQEASSKSTSFRGNTFPLPPYKAGDRFTNDSGEEWVCSVTRATGAVTPSDWQPTIQNEAAITASQADSKATIAQTDASNALNIADDAEQTAEQAAEAAAQATVDAAAADSKASSAQSAAESAAGIANAADEKATTAQGTATNAKTTADGAASAAAAADTKATAAKDTADNAVSTASSAAATAGEAKTTATNAANAASVADTKATEAQQTASTAKTTADTAKSTAAVADAKATAKYGTCSTAGGTVAKAVTLANFTLFTGAEIAVKFTNANTAASATLNVNGTGAKQIRAYNAALASGSPYNWAAQSTVNFAYDGTYWHMVDSAALNKANSAQTVANSAASTATQADTKANAAQTTAEDAASTAQSAATVAEQADTKATAAKTTAESAASTATQADTKATNAQSTANQASADVLTLAGKTGKTIYQESAPTGSNANANNLWIKTSTGQPYTYNGTTWVLVTDARITSAASTANAAQTAATNAASAASAADTKAGQAKTAADNAASTASAADTKASQAQSTATGAASAAAAADTKATNAASAAASADTKATNAATAASTADKKATAKYGTCSTAGGTVAKAVTLANFTLFTGAEIAVKFTNANTAASATLNVNGTGAKQIRAYNAALASGSPYNWAAQSTVNFAYDGTYWHMVDSAALSKANAAQTTAAEAKDAIEQTANYFFHDSAGAHVASTDGDANVGANVLMSALQIALRQDEVVQLAIKQATIEFLDSQGLLGLVSTNPLFGNSELGFDLKAGNSRALNLYSNKGVTVFSSPNNDIASSSSARFQSASDSSSIDLTANSLGKTAGIHLGALSNFGEITIQTNNRSVYGQASRTLVGVLDDFVVLNENDLAAFNRRWASGLIENLVYSTSEQPTGRTWVDGKKIYRRCFQGTITQSANSANSIALLPSGSGIEHAITYDGYFRIYHSGTGVWREYVMGGVNNNAGYPILQSATMELQGANGPLIFKTFADLARTNATYAIAVEYTKV